MRSLSPHEHWEWQGMCGANMPDGTLPQIFALFTPEMLDEGIALPEGCELGVPKQRTRADGFIWAVVYAKDAGERRYPMPLRPNGALPTTTVMTWRRMDDGRIEMRFYDQDTMGIDPPPRWFPCVARHYFTNDYTVPGIFCGFTYAEGKV